MKPAILIVSTLVVAFVLITAVAFINSRDDAPEKHVEVVLREIGHQLLLSAKDSTSRVLPIRKTKENSYQVSFQNGVGFVSDTLVNIVHRTFQKNPIANNYIVNLRNCEKKETVLAFEMNGKTGDLTPCKGRKLEYGCYIIEIDLLRESGFNYAWLWLMLIPLGFAGYYMADKRRKKDSPAPVPDTSEFIQLGIFRFLAANNVLTTERSTITLSDKESRALEIFVLNLNQVVEREKLMKALWEDEGTVVISRNVDVLVSKLRKKLAEDGSLKFVNVHGRGYKLVHDVV